tara:strand:- start:199 stop:693 length:495 start_codon:yes stop_codon:yes gene_type:complete
MARITVEDCIDKFPSRFELVLVASQRARKLHSGDEPTVSKDNDKNTVIALREIADTTLTVDQMKENLIQEYQTVTINDEEEENLELESANDEFIDNTNNNENKDDNSEEATSEIEEELTSLVSSEDKEIEEQYEISENLSDVDNSEENQDQESEEKKIDTEILE